MTPPNTTPIETKIKRASRQAQLFYVLGIIFTLRALEHVHQMYEASGTAAPMKLVSLVTPVGLAFGFYSLAMLFRLVTDILDELRGTV